MGKYDKIDTKGFSEFPDLLGRKFYEYRKPIAEPKTISVKIADNGLPMPDTDFRTIGATVRGFSFLFPNASDKLKENFVPTTSLLNIESETEETANALTQSDFFPEEKIIKDCIDEYNGVTIKQFINESYFLYDKSNLIYENLCNSTKQIRINIWFIQVFSRKNTKQKTYFGRC